MKIKFAAIALLLSGALCCSDSFGNDLLGRLVGRGAGCGCDAAPTCCDSPAAVYGGHSVSGNVHRHGLGLFQGLRGRGIGCGSYANVGCGCDAPVYGGNGCGGVFSGRLRGLFQRDHGFGGWGGNGCGGCDSGCSAAPVSVPVAAGCGADFGHSHGYDACGCGGRTGLLSGGLRGRFGSLGSNWGNGCGCGSLANQGCGCGSAAPVAAGCGADQGWNHGSSCGCGDGFGGRPGLLSGLRGRLGSRFGSCGCGSDISGCGCGAAPVYAAPVTANCGCNGGSHAHYDDGCGFGGRRGGLLNRFRGFGGGFGSDCGCGGYTSGGYVSAGCGVDGGSYAPAQGGQVIPVEAQPQGAAPAGEVVVPPTTTGRNQIKAPAVDPNAFIIRNTGYRN